jgi:hypothetical protein
MKKIVLFFVLIITSSCSNNNETGQKNIGDNYQGGKIAYVFKQGDLGYVEGEFHGIIAATTDLETRARWLNTLPYSEIGGTHIQIGYGKLNTQIIVNYYGSGDYAAKRCYDLVLNGYDDWYLPSKSELQMMCLNQNLIGGFKTGVNCSYWSSSEINYLRVWYNGFCNCYQEELEKVSELYIRPVRSF